MSEPTFNRCDRCGTDQGVVRFGARRLCNALCGPAAFGSEWHSIAGGHSEGSPASRPPSVSEVDTMANGENQVQPSVDSEGRADSALMTSDRLARSDCKMVRAAIAKRWPVTPEIRRKVVDRMVVVVDGPNDQNAIAASKTILQADALSQTDEQERAKYDRLDSGQPTELVVIQPPPRARVD